MAFELLGPEARNRAFAGIDYILFPEPVRLAPATPQTRPNTGARTFGPQHGAASPARQPQGDAPRARSWQPGTGQGQQQRTAPAPNRQATPQPARQPWQQQPGQPAQGQPVRQQPPRLAQPPLQQVFRKAPEFGQPPVPPFAPAGQAVAQPAPQTAGQPDPSTWPAGWQSLLQRTKKGRVAWTYFGLGYDLCGFPNTERRNRLADLIRFLALPAGTHTFWPIGLPRTDEDGNLYLQPDKEIFWQGLHLLGARVLIVMGSPAARGIGITGAIRPMMPLFAYRGLRLLVTWDIDGLDNQTNYLNTRTYLQQTLKSLVQ